MLVSDFQFVYYILLLSFFALVPLAGHNKAVDYWSFGIVIFELLLKVTPFMHTDATHISLCKKILDQNKIHFPSMKKHGISVGNEAKALIRGLLIKTPTDRLGSLAGGVDGIWHHSWFKGILLDKNKLLEKKIRAPWLPDIKDPLDASHFDIFPDKLFPIKYRQKIESEDQINRIFIDF